MFHSNSWFLVTSDEICEIQQHLEVIGGNDGEKRYESIRAVEKLLAGIEQRMA